VTTNAETPVDGAGQVLLVARFAGHPEHLQYAYDRAHALLKRQPGPPIGELVHHCAIGDDGLYIVGVWESEAQIRARFADPGFAGVLRAAGFPAPHEAEVNILRLHVSEGARNG
jgi:hypothetical protein